MEKIFALIEKTCFQGHTHIPGVFTDTLDFLEPEQIGFKFRLGAGKVMINVGSVGQPRDDDPRASYALYDYEERILLMRRVEYDIKRAQARFKKAGLPDRNAARIAKGE